ncbi:MAG: ABC transporter permease [Planctomycetota bacterium]|nr:ABC transporter permease [Planctomycetota bacterium]
MIRSRLVSILLDREFRRLRKNPSALMLIGLLSAVALLMATSRPVSKEPGNQAGVSVTAAAGSSRKTLDVWLIYDQRARWLDYLAQNPPESPTIRIVHRDRVPVEDGQLKLPPGDAAVLVLYGDQRETSQGIVFGKVILNGRYPGDDPAILKPFWDWFWPTVTTYHTNGLRFEQSAEPLGTQTAASVPASLEDTSVADLVTNELIATMLLLIVMFFACCHLLVSFTSQDRERGTLAALVLSPARTSEILLAKFIFHLLISLGGCLAIVAILKPIVLTQPVLWLTILLTSVGLMCVGTCIATLAKTQASAALLALCYMLGGTVLFYLATKFTAFAFVKQLAFENYTFPLLYATMKHPVSVLHAPGLGAMVVLVGVWITVARTCFYRYGWR